MKIMKKIKIKCLLLFSALICSLLFLPQVVLGENQDEDVLEAETKNIVVEEGESLIK